MVFDARLPVPACEPATPAEVVAGDLVLTAAAVPDPVAAVVHRDAGVVQTPELLRPAAETSGTIIKNFFLYTRITLELVIFSSRQVQCAHDRREL